MEGTIRMKCLCFFREVDEGGVSANKDKESRERVH